MPFIFTPPHVRFVEIIIDQKLIIFNRLHDTFISEEHKMIKMCAPLREQMNDLFEGHPILHSVPLEYL
ncbi:hypothetical protein DVA44_04305 [Leclercia sp. W17]|nr:hypothetical protein DVA44_04305 [Leclercia sp. W17]